jgi:hypothetical protein
MRRIVAVVAAALGLLVSAGQATAAPGDSALELAAQAAASAQGAGAQSGASQSQPSNKNVSVRVLSPGDNGDVSQSNTVSSDATAANANVTGQSADQTQSGSCGCTGGTQATGQEADSSQAATALSYAKQSGASNTNIPVRVLSPGDNGDVTQSNSVESDATAVNANATGQSAEQAAAGSGTQAIGQDAENKQDAAAASAAEQKGAENTNISVRVLSPGNDGKVTQSNSVDSSAKAGNLNLAGQKADQGQGGSGGTQAIGQDADNDQSATALSAAKQDGATNKNIPVRVLSRGDGGDVSQSNSVDSSAAAGNLNVTKQYADQDQGGKSKGECGCASDGIQAIGQDAKSEQSAGALSVALQSGASNTNTPVRVGSKGDDGDVSQSNSVESNATALNANLTGQKADQEQSGDCRCASGGTQAIGQEAKNDQSAAAASLAAQSGGHDRCGCGSSGNTNTPVRVDSKGDGGSVEQSNSVDSSAKAANLNLTGQDADQAQGGSGTQAIGQEAKNEQDALAASAALQSGASNTNTPVRVDSKGDDGDVAQSNSVDSHAKALNANLTKQDADQAQHGSSCGCGSDGTQAIGQEAKSEQGAAAFSLGLQHGASNDNAPVRVDSKGDGGSVDQSNSVDSDATAANLNALKQDADQEQAGSGGIQAIGQEAKNEQAAIALSAALQHGASNSNTPVRVDSKGDGGDVSQSNSVDSDATALNVNLTKQDADQKQGGRDKECGCHGTGIQAIGQEAKSEQGALAASLAAQAGASNENAPVRVDSKGDGGSVDQSNSVDSDATAANLNALKQDADQEQAGGGGIAIQAIGQSAKNEQAAIGLSAALQFGASNSNTPVAVDSKGDSGDVSQSNSVESDATALNINLTKQDADQDQGGRGMECGCHKAIGIQAIGQEAKNEQGALAGSLAIQAFGRDKCGCPSGGNSNTPVGVGSYGSGGSVDQSNSARSSASALNLNALFQDADQAQSGGGGTQAVGQSAKNGQHAIGLSAALQLAAKNAKGRSHAE